MFSLYQQNIHFVAYSKFCNADLESHFNISQYWKHFSISHVANLFLIVLVIEFKQIGYELIATKWIFCCTGIY